MNDSAQRDLLPEAASLLLDIFRFALAVLVVAGHMSLHSFTLDWPWLVTWADAAVPGFFVLSGFVIRYVTLDRERSPRRYFISRAARMYSVLLPAIVLTLAARIPIRAWHPAYAESLFGAPAVLATAARVVAHLLFFTQFWGHAVLLPPNIPLWSLGYEVPYYIFFGLLVLCRGPWRWWAAAVYALLVGPQVLFLLPLWWSGCLLFDVWQWARSGTARRRVEAIGACVVSLLALLLTVHGSSGFARIAALPDLLLLLHAQGTRATMFAYASGAVCWVALLLGLLLTDALQFRRGAPWERAVRHLAEGTFTLYLLHWPLLCLVVARNHGPLATWRAAAAVFLGVIAFCVVVARPVDRLKLAMRRWLSALWPAH